MVFESDRRTGERLSAKLLASSRVPSHCRRVDPTLHELLSNLDPAATLAGDDVIVFERVEQREPGEAMQRDPISRIADGYQGLVCCNLLSLDVSYRLHCKGKISVSRSNVSNGSRGCKPFGCRQLFRQRRCCHLTVDPVD